MSRNPHLFTVYHSLEANGAFDNQVHTEYPKYVRKQGHQEVIVNDVDEEADVIKLWNEQDVLKAKTEEIHTKNVDALNKKELQEKARSLGIDFDGRTSEKKLAYMIEEAEKVSEKIVA